MSKVHLPKGMRDLLPHNMLRRNLVIEKIKKTFEIFGFLPLETPAMERKGGRASVKKVFYVPRLEG